jgi:hypothetical protein
VTLALDGTTAQCFEQSDVECPVEVGRSIVLRAGRVLVTREQGTSVSWALPQAGITFGKAKLSILADGVFSEVAVVQGSIRAERPGEAREFTGPIVAVLGARFTAQPLDSRKHASLLDELRGPRVTHLLWDFESETLPCALGRRASPGAADSRGALMQSREFAALGSERAGDFKAPANARLRFFFNTNAPVLRISFTSGSGRGARQWYTQVDIAGNEWKPIEIALGDFKPLDDGMTPWPGEDCGHLQFRMKFPQHSEIMPSERRLLIDDVEIFSPK